MKKVIVTGANGFIGPWLVKLLIKNNYFVFAYVKDENADVSQLSGLSNIEIMYCEMHQYSDLYKYLIGQDIFACIHLAWSDTSGIGRSNYLVQIENVKSTLDLVNSLKILKVKKFIGAGSLAEKDVLNYHPTLGATPTPVSHYGIAKLAAHFTTKTECSKYDIEHVWCYFGNTYGIGNRTSNFVNFAAKLFLNGERASFTKGEQLYDFVYVTDTVSGITHVLEKGISNHSYYIGSSSPIRLKDFIVKIPLLKELK